jgi:hypothetical protein
VTEVHVTVALFPTMVK